MTDAEWIPVADAVELVRADMEQKARAAFKGEPPPSQVRLWHQEHQEAARRQIWRFWRGDRLLLRASTIKAKLSDSDEPTVRPGGEITDDDWGPGLNGIGLTVSRESTLAEWRRLARNPPTYPSSNRFISEQPTWEWTEAGSLIITKDRVRLKKMPASELVAFTGATGIEVNIQDLRYAFGLEGSANSAEQAAAKLSPSAINKAAASFANGKLSHNEVFELVISSLGARPTQTQWRKAWGLVPTEQKLPRGRRPQNNTRV
jgi:hypothetical protein